MLLKQKVLPIANCRMIRNVPKLKTINLQQHRVRSKIISAQQTLASLKQTKCSEEGWRAPAQFALLTTLNGRDIERGQATLPHLHLSELDLSSCWLSADDFVRRAVMAKVHSSRRRNFKDGWFWSCGDLIYAFHVLWIEQTYDSALSIPEALASLPHLFRLNLCTAH